MELLELRISGVGAMGAQRKHFGGMRLTSVAMPGHSSGKTSGSGPGHCVGARAQSSLGRRSGISGCSLEGLASCLMGVLDERLLKMSLSFSYGSSALDSRPGLLEKGFS